MRTIAEMLRWRARRHPALEAIWFEGTWGEYVNWVTETKGAEALEPHRIKYKRFER